MMKRIALIVSGKIQKAGYREKVIDIGKNLELTGYSEKFKDHINIQNTLIKVSNIKCTSGKATGEFSGFSKLVKGGETDERLDTAATLLKELIGVTRNGFSSMKEDTSAMLEKQDLHIEITRNGFNDVKNEIKNVKNEIHLQRDDFKEMFMRE